MGFGGGAAAPLVTPANPSTQLANDENVPCGIGTPVYQDALGGFKRAIATDAATAAAIGMVSDVTILPGAIGGVQVTGIVVATAAQWDLITGGSGGLQAVPYYVSDATPGMLTTVAPAIAVEVGVGLTAMNFLLKPSSVGSGGGGGQTDYVNVRSAPYSAKGDGITDDTAAIQAAHNAAALAGTTLLFPKGTYLVTNQGGSPPRCLTIAASAEWMGGRAAVIKFDSTIAHGTYIAEGVVGVTIEGGLKFQGYVGPSDDAWIFNAFWAIYVASTVADVDVHDCNFDHCAPVFWQSDDTITSTRFSFDRNRVIDSPAEMGVANYSIITDNWFHCGEVSPTRTHAIYAFGPVERMIATGNSFLNIGSADIQIRATDAHHLQKRGWIITNNMFENSGQYSIFIATLSSEIEPGTLLIGSNTFKNVNTPMQLIGVRDAIVDGNVMEWDYRFAGSTGNQGVTLGSSPGGGQTSIARGNRVTNNRIINRHPFWGTIHITGIVSDGDVVVVGAQTYTFRNSPSVSGDVQISSNADDCAQYLSYEIGGYGLTPRNLILRDGTDTFYSLYTGEGKCFVASGATFTLTATAANITIPTQKASLYIPGVAPGVAMKWNSTYRAKTAGGAGDSITLRSVGDASSGAGTIDDSTTDVVFHFMPNVSTPADMDTLAATSTHIEVQAAGTMGRVLTAADAFTTSHLQLGFDAVWDFSNAVVVGIGMSMTDSCVIEANSIELGVGASVTPISIDHNLDPVVRNNAIAAGSPRSIVGAYNVLPLYDGNRNAVRHDVASTPLASDHFLLSYDAFPTIRNMDLVNDQVNILPWMQGASGWTPVGDGKAECYAFFGDELGVDDPRYRAFHWEDGDYFQLYDGTTTFNFQFKRTAPNGITEFNSYATLLALINTQTGGEYTASNPVSDYFGSDTQGNGYLRVKFASAGAQATATLDTSVNLATNGRSRSCGVTLDNWQANVTLSRFAGGAATKIKTVVWTPLASKNVPLIVQGVDATSQALNPIAYQADVLPGIAYVITHDAAAGTEAFSWRVG